MSIINPTEIANIAKAANNLETPAYIILKEKLIKNLKVLKKLENNTGCKILLAQKAFSMYSLYPLIAEYISGTTASGIYEARLGYEHMQGENHVFSPAYKENDFSELVKICSHIVFNSFNQFEKYKKLTVNKGISLGIRINPEHSTQGGGIYDPCSKHSRLGATLYSLKGKDLSGIEGFHFHALCEQNSDALEETLEVVIKNFIEDKNICPKTLKWINLGGGHHITKDGYDLKKLEELIKRLKNYGLLVYLEPGEAIALNAGILVTTVLDIVNNDMNIAILDTSAACHMPDILEMPYRPSIIGSDEAGKKEYTYRLGGNTCLAGDIIGDYSFDAPLKIGDRLVLTDMAIYTMVKNNTFNGMPLPKIAILNEDNSIKIVKKFDYNNFKERL